MPRWNGWRDEFLCVLAQSWKNSRTLGSRFRSPVGGRERQVALTQPVPLFFFPLLLQGESGASSSSSPAKSSILSDGSAHSSGSFSSSTQHSVPQEQVHTQQPCSLKGSFSSDNIYAGRHGDGMAHQAAPSQGTTH